MALDPQLAAMLKQIVSVSVTSSTANVYGEIVVGSAATYYCRMESRTRTVERMDGTFEATRAPLMILDSSTFTPTFETRFWLPGNSASSAAFGRRAKHIEICVDENGAVSHWELEF